MASVLRFCKPARIPDIEFVGGEGFYCVYAQSDAGVNFLETNVAFEPWQGSPRRGIAIEDTRFAQEIAQGALDEGCLVRVNGKEL